MTQPTQVFTVDADSDVDKLPDTTRAIVNQIWAICPNTWCILTDHDFTHNEAAETLHQLLCAS